MRTEGGTPIYSRDKQAAMRWERMEPTRRHPCSLFLTGKTLSGLGFERQLVPDP
jgi:hypothetical protein